MASKTPLAYAPIEISPLADDLSLQIKNSLKENIPVILALPVLVRKSAPDLGRKSVSEKKISKTNNSLTLELALDQKIITTIEEEIGADLFSLLNIFQSNSKGKVGEIFSHVQSALVTLTFIIVEIDNLNSARKSGSALGRMAKQKKVLLFDLTLLPNNAKSKIKKSLEYQHVNGLVLSNYLWNWKAERNQEFPKVFLANINAEELARYLVVARGVWEARDLIHTPTNIKNTEWLISQSKAFIKDYAQNNLSLEVWKGKDIERFGGLLAIGNSSRQPGPRLLQIKYKPAGAKRRIALVGKGITYDTGGISLKRPYDVMLPMKSDMAGAAAVISTVLTAARLNLPVEVIGIALLAENAISGSSTRPSDVISHYDGKTVEVLNTDAEGRLLLADGLAFACDRFAPDYVIDVATLTGAATLGLSRQYGALYSGSDDLANALSLAGENSGEALWRMPLVEEYKVALESSIADLNHTADKGDFSGGSITAALFLAEFVPAKYQKKWAHLDIAGPARSDVDAGENVKGGTGFGVRVLTNWMENL
jgi:leucyl aminopeptidase